METIKNKNESLIRRIRLITKIQKILQSNLHACNIVFENNTNYNTMMQTIIQQ